MDESFDHLPPAIRAFLSAITVLPDVTEAARVAARALKPGEYAKAEQRDELRKAYTAIASTLRDNPGSKMLKDKLAEVAGKLQVAEAAAVSIEKTADSIRVQHYDHLRRRPAYKEAFVKAWELGLLAIEDWACRRAMTGWDEPVYQGGFLVGYKHKVSDRVLIKLLETRFPETWGKQKVEHSGSVALGAELSDDDLRSLIRRTEAILNDLQKAGVGEGQAEPVGDVLPGDGPASA